MQNDGVITNATDWRSHAKQGRCIYNGLPITIENERGSYRQGTDDHGKPWRTFMHIAYGYIQLTEGVDGDHVDVYLGPNEFSNKTFVVHQVDPKTGKYDEDKVMLGFNDASAAKANYVRQYDSAKYFGTMDMYDMDTFKRMLVERRGLTIKKSLEKAKYIKRWRGKDGKWNYEYLREKKDREASVTNNTLIGGLVGIENIISKLKYEKGYAFNKEGEIISVKSGNKDNIDYTSADLKGMKDNNIVLYTHNHPNGDYSFSLEDLKFSHVLGCKIRAISDNYTYEAEIPNNWTYKNFENFIGNFLSVKDEMTVSLLDIPFHDIWQKLNGYKNFKYKRVEKRI